MNLNKTFLLFIFIFLLSCRQELENTSWRKMSIEYPETGKVYDLSNNGNIYKLSRDGYVYYCKLDGHGKLSDCKIPELSDIVGSQRWSRRGDTLQILDNSYLITDLNKNHMRLKAFYRPRGKVTFTNREYIFKRIWQ